MATSKILTAIKILASVPVGLMFLYPFLWAREETGLLREISLLGPIGAPVFIGFFLLMVFLYCRDLERCLTLVRPEARAAKPSSVWLMFLLPYNFIEDFFIMANIAKSIREEARHNTVLAPFTHGGLVAGIGWCAAQIVSLVPGHLGLVAGMVAIALWLWHWYFVRSVSAALMGGLRAPT